MADTRAWRVAVAGIALGLACARPAPPAPEPTSLLPDHGTGNVTTDVQIFGTHFDPVVHMEFGSPNQSTVDETFHAWLVDSAGTRTELTSVKFVSTEQLVGTIPSGLALGLYAIAVQGPRGPEISLSDAYRVVTPVENVAGFAFELIADQRVNVPFGVGLSAVDSVGRVVDGFTGLITLSATNGGVTPTTVGPFALGRARAQVSLAAVRSFEVLTASGLNKFSSSNPFAVLPRMAQSLGFASSQQFVSVNVCSGPLVVHAQEADDTPTQLTSDLPVLFSSGSPGMTFHTDAMCSPGNAITQVLLPAYTPSVTVYFKAATAGNNVPVRALAISLVAGTQLQTVSP